MDSNRHSVIEQLSDRPLDVLVVGGGIVGAGIARDAAMRGLHVGLVEQHDLAFGTSSRSSRLLPIIGFTYERTCCSRTV